ncbi:MAG: hypothetical protein P8079_05230 [Gammaproteobacteria bacterium]
MGVFWIKTSVVVSSRRDLEVGRRDFGGNLGMLCLFLRRKMLGGQGHAAPLRIPGQRQLSFPLGNDRALLFRLRHQLRRPAYRFRQCRLCLVQVHTGRGVIQCHQGLPLLHRIHRIGVDRHDRARAARHDRYDIAAHVGIVGGFPILTHSQPVPADTATNQQKQQHQD